MDTFVSIYNEPEKHARLLREHYHLILKITLQSS